MHPKVFFGILFTLSLSFLARAEGQYKTLKLDGHGDKSKSNAVLFVEQVLESAYAPLGYTLTYQQLPLARSFIEANLGRLDGLRARVSSSAERYPNLVAVPFALFDFEVLLVGKRNHCGYCQLRQLNTVATIRGFKALDDYFSQLAYQPAIVRLTNVLQVLDMLQKGRVDAIILPSNAFSQNHWQDINTWSKYPLISHPDFHFLHKKHKQLIPLVLAEMQRMQRQGKLQSLRHKYHMYAPAAELKANSLPEVNLYLNPGLSNLLSERELQQLKAIFSIAASKVTLNTSVPDKVTLASTDILLGVRYENNSKYLFSDMHLTWDQTQTRGPLFVAFANDEMGHNLKVLFEKQYRLFKTQQTHEE